MAVLQTDVGGGPTGITTTVDLMGTTLHLVRVAPTQMRALQRVGTHHFPFLNSPEWPSRLVLESHMRNAAAQTGHPQPNDGEVRFGARTSGHYHKPEHAGTMPTTSRRNKWSMYQARCQRYSSWHLTDSKPLCDLEERAATCG